MNLTAHLSRGSAPIIAILRGVSPTEVVGVGAALVEAGIKLLEVPLNSPQPLESIALLQREFGEQALVGAGTVLTAAQVTAVSEVGGRLIVSPNVDGDVIARTTALGLDSLPGFQTATEAFAAVAAGALHLKLFPATSFARSHVAAIREVLPHGISIWAVGGIGAHNLSQWTGPGVTGVGVGGSLYKPGDSALTVAGRAKTLLEHYNNRLP